jgi:hypothetical protein
MRRLGQDTKQEIAAFLGGLRGAERAAAVQMLAATYGVSEQTISAVARRAGASTRPPRRDRGSSSLSLDDVKAIAATVYATRRLDGRIPLSMKSAIRKLDTLGLLQSEGAYSTFCREARRHHISKADLRRADPHLPRSSAHPNWEWQIDASACIQWYFDEGGLQERDVTMQLHKNHPAEFRKIRSHIIRYVLIDEASGCFLVRYFDEPGERAKTFLEFLIDAWQPPERWNHWRTPHQAFRFYGVPFRLLADRGAFGKSTMVRQFLARCGVELHTHLPGNPRAKGLVEGTMALIEKDFEAWLKFQRPRDLAELNRWAWEWTLRVNCIEPFREHIDPRGRTRLQWWLSITQEQLRVPPPVKALEAIVSAGLQVRRVNGDGRLKYEGRFYRVPDTNLWGREVQVSYNPFAWDAKEVEVTALADDGHMRGQWLLRPLTLEPGGFLSDCVRPGEIRRPAPTATQRAKTELQQIATDTFGVGWKGTGDKRQALPPPPGRHRQVAHDHGAEAAAQVVALPRSGEDLSVRTPAAERRISLMGLLGEVAEALGRHLTPAENHAISAAWPNGCRMAELDTITACASCASASRCAGIWKGGECERSDERRAEAAGA